MTGIGGGHVTCGIARGDRRTHITIGGQHRSRNIHAPGLAIGIDGRLVGLDADFYGNRVTRFHFIAHLTGDCNGLAGLAAVNHVI